MTKKNSGSPPTSGGGPSSGSCGPPVFHRVPQGCRLLELLRLASQPVSLSLFPPLFFSPGSPFLRHLPWLLTRSYDSLRRRQMTGPPFVTIRPRPRPGPGPCSPLRCAQPAMPGGRLTVTGTVEAATPFFRRSMGAVECPVESCVCECQQRPPCCLVTLSCPCGWPSRTALVQESTRSQTARLTHLRCHDRRHGGMLILTCQCQHLISFGPVTANKSSAAGRRQAAEPRLRENFKRKKRQGNKKNPGTS